MNRNGIRGIIVQSILIIIGFVILFVAAGTLKWVNGWIYVFLIAVSQAANWIVLAKINPQLLNARSSITKEGTKGFERVWLVLYPIFTFGNLIVMGFDAVRFHWSSMPAWLTIVGIAMFIPALVTATWAMSVNKFFEWTVRIQDDRSQLVCTDGPYSVIRHPGYTGLIVSLLAYPLILGSWWGLVASFILTAIIVVRTVLEDRTLQIELPGYKEYAGKVKYRLLPFIW